MKKSYKSLLLFDAIVNLILGIVLLLFPLGIAEPLGLPVPSTYFYSFILGGVLFGIGLALLMGQLSMIRKYKGLEIGGAIVINFCGSIALLVCLAIIRPEMPLHGRILLWGIGILVLVIGIVEVKAG